MQQKVKPVLSQLQSASSALYLQTGLGNAGQTSLPEALLLLCMQSAGAQTRGIVAEASR